eukprot:scaffold34646_cov173-Amphora_coffeaeformis.AAC.30
MTDKDPNGRLNATILDPQRWGWTAGSGVADLLTPQERARRSGTKKAFLRSNKRKREWKDEVTTSFGDERDALSNELVESPAGRKIQSTEPIDESQRNISESGTSHLKKQPLSSLPAASSATELPSENATALATSVAASANSKNDTSPAIFSALMKPTTGNETEESLDWYSYHRGRAGLERRDDKTGDLQYDVPQPTDTNHSVDEPNWSTAKISVRFPLGMSNERKSLFRETVVWDWMGHNNLIVDAEAHEGGHQPISGLLERTPMEIAGAVAQEYGLTFPETMDLAEYIQGQLRTWVQQEALYAPPVTQIDPHTGVRREKPSAIVTELYGNVISMTEGGIEDKPTVGMAQRSYPIPRRHSSVESSSKKSQKAKPQTQKKETKKIVLPDQESMEEVRRRLLAESMEEIKKKASGDEPTGMVEVREGLSCHVCTATGGVFAQFACGREGHSFCRLHIRHKMGVPLDSDPISIAHCPICALHCGCDSCTTTLEGLAVDLKNCSSEQGCSIKETQFDNLLEKARASRMEARNRNTARSKRKTAVKSKSREKVVVPKVPVTDLPREVSEGIDIDPGTDADYAATYTEKGPIFPPGLSLSIEPAKADLATKTSFTLEDGSVDFCNICKKIGSLLCCDFCPRAFHASCLKPSDVDEQSDTPWECPSCRAEKAGLEEDKVDGTKSLAMISAAYGGSENGSDQERMLFLLATIHQMLLRLLEYDFGYMFSEPVDTTCFPEYLNIVKKPMDLGTISKKLLDGSYKETGEESLETIAIKALEDVDLVWKNCYLFNVEGSSVYRMALVQERRANATYEKSINHLLSDNIMMKLGTKLSTAELGRARPATAVGVQGVVRPQKSRHKITVSRRNHNGHPIAVLDPETRKIVKIYSTMQAAGAAVVFLLGLGHRCEWHNFDIETVSKVRRLVKDAHKNPSSTLFGYRWLMLEALRTGEVSFPKDDPTKTRVAFLNKSEVCDSLIIKKIDDEGAVRAEFKSVDEAYEDCLNNSSAELNGGFSKTSFRDEYLDGNKTLHGNTYMVENASTKNASKVTPCSFSESETMETEAKKAHYNFSTDTQTSIATKNGALHAVSTVSSSTKNSLKPDENGLSIQQPPAKSIEVAGIVPIGTCETGEDPIAMDQNLIANADVHSASTGKKSVSPKPDVPVFLNGSNAPPRESNGD